MVNPVLGLKQIPHQIYDVLRPLILRSNYYLGNFKSSVWLFGDGRSGTTFVSDLINYDSGKRELFEPFHPKFVKAMQGSQFHQFLRQGTNDNNLIQLGSQIFSGRMVDKFVDSSSTKLIYRNLLIKDIFVNLLAYWAVHQFSNYNIKPVLLVRNPFAVALSKYKKQDWEWMTDPRDFLLQEQLVADYLQPFVDEITNVGNDYIGRQVMIWAIIHYVPFKQFRNKELHVLFYEDLLTKPRVELGALFNYLDMPVTEVDFERILKKMAIPSRVTGPESSIVRGGSPIESWCEEISEQQLQHGNKILKTFGLDHIYGEHTMPQVSAKELLLNK